jgi:hypothetical protein
VGRPPGSASKETRAAAEPKYPTHYYCDSWNLNVRIQEGSERVADPVNPGRTLHKRKPPQDARFRKTVCDVQGEARRLRMPVPEFCGLLKATDAFRGAGRYHIPFIWNPDVTKGRRSIAANHYAPPPKKPDGFEFNPFKAMVGPVTNAPSKEGQAVRTARGDRLM